MTQHAPLIIDIAGLKLSKDDRCRLKHPLTGGIILFARNWKDRQQLGKLCAEIKALRDDLLICVDHEGGRVQRFRTDGLTHLPPAVMCWAPSCAPAALISASRRCSTSILVKAA